LREKRDLDVELADLGEISCSWTWKLEDVHREWREKAKGRERRRKDGRQDFRWSTASLHMLKRKSD
jgi:hypothetical protein